MFSKGGRDRSQEVSLRQLLPRPGAGHRDRGRLARGALVDQERKTTDMKQRHRAEGAGRFGWTLWTADLSTRITTGEGKVGGEDWGATSASRVIGG